MCTPRRSGKGVKYRQVWLLLNLQKHIWFLQKPPLMKSMIYISVIIENIKFHTFKADCMQMTSSEKRNWQRPIKLRLVWYLYDAHYKRTYIRLPYIWKGWILKSVYGTRNHQYPIYDMKTQKPSNYLVTGTNFIWLIFLFLDFEFLFCCPVVIYDVIPILHILYK